MGNIRVRTALVHMVDGRSDFYARREKIALEEVQSLGWLREAVDVVESPILQSVQDVKNFVDKIICSGVQSVIIHFPIWADPIFSIKLHNLLDLPILLLGNDRPDTSSLVGLLGAGGALDQVGVRHLRVFEHHTQESRREVLAYLRAASTVKRLRGQTLGLFGGRSLGITTAGADAAQWQRLFGVDIENLDQCEIVHQAESMTDEEVNKQISWLTGKLSSIEYSDNFTPRAFEKQVRSYLATRLLAEKHGFDFVGVKCQPEMTDGYVSQCVSHCLINGVIDADGKKEAFVHACESDADGALTMQILNGVSEGNPTALLDMRWYNAADGTWILANCGAVAAAFFADGNDPTGFGHLRLQAHVFGKGGGGALSGAIQPQEVTLARLCRRDGQYWMAILPAHTKEMDRSDLAKTTAAFPQACVEAKVTPEFPREFGSNHIHMVAGDFSQELIAFCQFTGIPWKIWK